MEPSQDTIIEVKEELMVSPLSGEKPLHRTAYFIKPCLEESATVPHSMFSSKRTTNVTSNRAKMPLLEVRYNGWHYPHEEWKTWFQQMQHKYEHVWIKAGIDKAIKASTFQIRRNDELILELAQRWCSKTNTFIFPWGEATITLEDMKVCWGYSVLGAPFSSPLESDQEKETEQELISVYRMFFNSKARRADHTPWMKHFMKNESKVEHEGFLSLWLSRFVFPGKSHNAILKIVFPIAICLARGTKLALAPAVLASIYRDLSLLNNKIRTSTKEKVGVTLWSPFQLVQVWALERFPALHPRLHVIGRGHLMMAKWHTVKILKHDNLKLILDSFRAGNGFIWRPYKNSSPLTLYNEEDMWVCNNPNFDDELESFARYLRVSELVGMECRKQYCPNRVAMQFGMDQDIPGMLTHYNENPWIRYSQLVMDTNLYTALCASHQPNVTSRYYHWWNQSNLTKEGDMHGHCVVSSSKHLLQLSSVKEEGEGSSVPPPGFTSKVKREQEEDFNKEGKFSIFEISPDSSPFRDVRGFYDKEIGNGKGLSSPVRVVFTSSSVERATSVKGYGKRVKMEDGKRVKMEDGKRIKIKNSFCDRNGLSGMERKYRCFDNEIGNHNALYSPRVVFQSSVEEARNPKDDGSRVKIENSFCDINGVSDTKREDAYPCTTDIASDLERRIRKLERVIAKLKAAKFGPKVQNAVVKREP